MCEGGGLSLQLSLLYTDKVALGHFHWASVGGKEKNYSDILVSGCLSRVCPVSPTWHQNGTLV